MAMNGHYSNRYYSNNSNGHSAMPRETNGGDINGGDINGGDINGGDSAQRVNNGDAWRQVMGSPSVLQGPRTRAV